MFDVYEARNLHNMIASLEEHINKLNAECCELTSQMVKMADSNSRNVLNAALAGLQLGEIREVEPVFERKTPEKV